MKKLKRYAWLFDFITAALLIALGIIFIAESKIVFYLMGALFLVFGVSRVIPLFKATENKTLKWLFVSEIIIEIIAGIVLIYLGTKEKGIGKAFGYIVGGVFYLRGFVYFFGTTFKTEPNTVMNFIFHFVLVSVGVMLLCVGHIKSDMVNISIATLLFICVAFQIIRGIKDYKNYLSIIKTEDITKKIKVKKEKKSKKNDSLPTSAEIKESEQDNVVA